MVTVRELELRYKASIKIKNKDAEINQPEKAYQFLAPIIGDATQEHFTVLLLDVHNTLMGWSTASIGTISETLCHPREIFKFAVRECAAGIIIAHNHPTGNTSPSKEDIVTTNRIVEAGNILGIKVLDSLIVTQTEFYSMKEGGYVR